MPNRIIKESICTSETIERLTAEEECFFYRIIVNCDDFGRTDARIPVITSRCYPLKSCDSKRKQVEKMLLSLQKAGLLFLYADEKYLQVVTWDKHQQIRAKRSKYPEPDDSDIKRYQLISDDIICYRNPIQSESESESESNINSSVLDYLNEKANTKYRIIDSNTKWIKARLKDGYSLDDFKTVIDKKVSEWMGTEQQKYLRPETLFGNKFDGYLNQNISNKVDFGMFVEEV